MVFHFTAHPLPKVFFFINFEPDGVKGENKDIYFNYDIDHCLVHAITE